MTAEPSKGSRPPEPGTDVCALDDIADGAARIVGFPTGWFPFEVIVVRKGDAVFGYVNECKHMAVPLNLLDDFAVNTEKHHMLCDHHCATFRFEDGYCVEGPCQGQSLSAVPLAVRAGRIVIA
jgi:nitrite reductase/ring-hydroxylating ferredoxin subunit